MSKLALPCGSILHGEKNTYRIEKVLGQGGFGITYLGTMRTTVYGALGSIETDVHVAIKEFFMRDVNGRSITMVTSSIQSDKYEEYKKKFKREATNLSELTRSFHHPHIINVYECFEANNTVYYVMEYVAGGSLNDYINTRGALPEKTCLRMAFEIGSALSYMHKRKMLHLDLKPGNIMLHSDGTIALIDFGLSKQFDKNGLPETSTNIGLGTVGYAPLEQANYHEGSQVIFPVTMDIYAMGGTLYKMLTGTCPPSADEIFNDGFPAQSLKDKKVSEGLIRCIAKAMSPKKVNRYSSVDAFLEDLSLCTGQKPKQKQPIDQTVEVVSVVDQSKDHQSSKKTKKESKEKKSVYDDDETVFSDVTQKETDQNVSLKSSRKMEEVISSGVKSSKNHNRTKIWIPVFVIMGILSFIIFTWILSKPVAPNLILSYGKWYGQVEKGKPDGTGTLVFTKTYKYKEVSVGQDCKLKGTFKEGTLVTGKVYSSNDSLIFTFKQPSPPNHESPVVHPSTSLDLSYGTWYGEVRNGKPDGTGTLKFNKPYTFYNVSVSAGYKLEGSFNNGRLEWGKFYNAEDSCLKTILP